jgi:hypothetical protein
VLSNQTPFAFPFILPDAKRMSPSRDEVIHQTKSSSQNQDRLIELGQVSFIASGYRVRISAGRPMNWVINISDCSRNCPACKWLCPIWPGVCKEIQHLIEINKLNQTIEIVC